MNYQFDVIIVGDSAAGNNIMKNIASANRGIKIAFISRDFKSKTTRDFLNVEYIRGEVTFTDYKNRLFCCYLKTGERHYCTHLVIASGIRYAPLKIGNRYVPGVFNTLDEIPKMSKNQAAVVFGNRDIDVKLAIAVAKKYKYTYLCTKDLELNITDSNKKKLLSTENLVVLHNAIATKAVFENDALAAVELDNYSTITCNAIFVKTTTTPETDFVSEKLISKNAEGYLETNSVLESTKVPKCFAVGNCVKKSSKKQNLALINSILKDF